MRKVRVGRSGSGKRGGARVIYYFYNADFPLVLMALYAKNELDRAGQEGIGSHSEGDHGVMAKKVKSRLADDLRAGLDELRDFVAGKKTGAVVHRIFPSHTDAREARHKLGLSQREFASLVGAAVGTVRKWELGTRRPSGAARTLIEVIKNEPKAVRRAIAKRNSAA